MGKLLKMRVKVTEVASNGKSFLTFKTLAKNKKWVDLRFTTSVKNQPTEDCFIVVDSNNANYSTAYQYPRIWVRAINEILPLTHNGNGDNAVEELFEEVK